MKQSANNGFSLVELMIAMTIGLVVTGFVMTAYLGSSVAYKTQQELARMQENGRFSFELISYAMREVGYMGCQSAVTRVANTVQGADIDLRSGGIRGYEIAGGDFNAESSPNLPGYLTQNGQLIAAAGTDVFATQALNFDDSVQIDVNWVNKGNAPAVLKLADGEEHSFEPGDVAIIVDTNCSQASVFVVTNGNNSNQINHNTGNTGTDISNCSKALRGDFDCTNAPNKPEGNPYNPGSSVYAFKSDVFYIAPSQFDANINSLYRGNPIDTFKDSRANMSTVELIQGISDMQLFYGIDSNDDSAVDQYMTANQIDDETDAIEWDQVSTVRIALSTSSLGKIDGEYLDRQYSYSSVLRNRLFQ